ncbi:hypothetical protein FQA39_LY01558 [Lamprigera yunnana]|nr:hypothetical protein FQA39_LY01558 [Lamprigera yunnana]
MFVVWEFQEVNTLQKMMYPFATSSLILENTEFEKNDCIKKVINEVFNEDKTIFLVKNDNNFNFELSELFKAFVVIDVNKPIVNRAIMFGKNFVIYVRDSLSLTKIFYALSNSTIWHPINSLKGKFVIITPVNNTSELFPILWKKYILNVVVIHIDDTFRPLVYVSDPHDIKNKCAQMAISLQAQECDSKVTFTKLYRKFTGCTMQIALGGLINLRRPNPDREFYLFYENLMRQYLKVSVEYAGKETTLTFFKDYSIVGIAYFPIFKFHGLEATEAILTTNMVWVLPLPLLMSPLKALFTIYSSDVWILVVITFLIVSLCWWFISTFCKRQRTFSQLTDAVTKVTSITFSNLAGREPTTFPLKCLLISYLFYIINMQTAYTCNLIRIFTSPPYEDGLNTLEDLAHSNITIYTTKALIKNYKKELNFGTEVSAKLKSQFVTVNSLKPKLIDVSIFRNCAVLIVDYNLLSSGVRNVKSIVNNSFTGPIDIGFFAAEGHYFIRTFNQLIRILEESGIYQKQIKNFKESFLKYFNVTEEENYKPTVLTVDHIYGVFILLGVGLGGACIIFFIELLCSRFQKK